MSVNRPNQLFQPVWDSFIEKRMYSRLSGNQRRLNSELESTFLSLVDKVLTVFSSSYAERKSLVSHQIILENLTIRRLEIKQRAAPEIVESDRLGDSPTQAGPVAGK